MAKRLTEAFKLLEKGYRRKMRKERWEKSIPSFENFKVDVSFKDSLDELKIIVTDILNVSEPKRKAKISTVSNYGSSYLINSIECPICGRILIINRHWNCFFCECTEHQKKIYEIVKVEMPPSFTGQDIVYLNEEENSN